MLTKEEKLEVAQVLRFSFKICPATADLSRGELEVETKRWKRLFCWVFYVTALLHVLLINLRLLHALLWEKGIPLHHLMIHLVLCAGGNTLSFWYFLPYIFHPVEHLAVISIALGLKGGLGSDQENQWESDAGNNEQNRKPRWQTYTLEDMIVIYSPRMVCVAAVAVWTVCAYDPNMTALLYSGLPESLKTPPVLILTLLEEARLFWFMSTMGITVFQLHVVIFGEIISRLRRLKRSITIRSLYMLSRARADVRTLKCIQLYVGVVNLSQRYVIHTVKLMGFAICIASRYAAIAHFSDHVLFGIMYYVLFIDMTLFYVVNWDKAFKVFEDTIREMLLRLGTHKSSSLERRVVERQLKGFPRVAIRVGDFHTLERTSTPTFFGFILTNIVNVLVAYG